VFREEVFGPVMTLVSSYVCLCRCSHIRFVDPTLCSFQAKFKTIDEVIHRANSTPYGLACGIFTKDVAKVSLACSCLADHGLLPLGLAGQRAVEEDPRWTLVLALLPCR
jgi:hypothetical protein